jgi:RNA polymerase sigma factor (sigma-70 family)
MSADQATVFVVDDDDAMRGSLRWLIESVGLKVKTFDSALDYLEAFDPDEAGCLVLDVRMPGMSGMELLENLSAYSLRPPVIIITGHGDVPMAVRAIKYGALDFIQKPFNDQELLDRIQQALDTDAKSRQEMAGLDSLKSRYDALTPRERQIMDMVAAGKSNKAVASELAISSRTVEVHRARIMKKLKVKTLADLVQANLQLSPKAAG